MKKQKKLHKFWSMPLGIFAHFLIQHDFLSFYFIDVMENTKMNKMASVFGELGREQTCQKPTIVLGLPDTETSQKVIEVTKW